MSDVTLSRRLADAWRDGELIGALTPEQVPDGQAAAYAVQHELLALRGSRIGGWKVGSKSADGPVQGAPLPADACHPSGAKIERRAYAPLGLELEIAFRFGRTFEPREEAYDADAVHAAIASMCVTVEIVASRYADWPNVDRFAQLADLQNHGALIVGEPVPYRADFPFETPSLRFEFDGANVVGERIANPAGDPRRLLAWVVNHCTQQRRIALTPEMVVTTGSYTGMFFPKQLGVARGEIDGIGAIQLELV